MTEVIGNYIKGTQINKTQGNYQDVFNPATGNVRAQVCMSTKAEVDEAVKVATEAAKEWGRTPSPKRAQAMFRFKRLLEENSDQLAKIISSDRSEVPSRFGTATRAPSCRPVKVATITPVSRKTT